MSKVKLENDSEGIRYKRCPECFTKLPINAKKCSSCNQKLLGPDKYGLAKKPFNWSGYATAILLWITLGFFIWWAFFKTK